MGRHCYLPDHVIVRILSYLPLRLAVRNSILCRRFYRLWETIPVLNLDQNALSLTNADFVKLANRAILHRSPPSPLLDLRLCLETSHVNSNVVAYISSILVKANSLGLRHLSVKLSYKILAAVLPLILSFESLESLSLEKGFYHEPTPPISVNLKHLKSLHLHREGFLEDFINQLVPQLDVLEVLHIETFDRRLDLKSLTLKKLRLSLFKPTKNMRIFAPSLELFELEFSMLRRIYQWDWDMPLLKKAVIRLDDISEQNVQVVYKMLHTIAHAHELHLDITEFQRTNCTPFIYTLLSHGADPPTFVNLKQLTLDICYHEFNIQDLVTIIQHSPALQVLRLVHKPPFCARKNKKKKLWRSMLPRNAEGNYKHAYFEDLHIAEKKDELLRKLTMKQSSKKRKRKMSS